MKAYFDTLIKPANEELAKSLGIRKIEVIYEPSIWKMADESYEFECTHDFVLYESAETSMYYDPENSFTTTITICADCGAELTD